MPVATLPDGLQVETPNDKRAATLHAHIFKAGVYLRHGVTRSRAVPGARVTAEMLASFELERPLEKPQSAVAKVL